MVDGGPWEVRRRWAPRLGPETLWRRFRRRLRTTFRRAGDASDAGCAFDVGEGIVALLVLLAAVLLLLFVLIPLLVALVDLLVVALLAVVGVASRVAFRRPWAVDAFGPDRQHLRWRVVGWRASGAKVAEVQQLLDGGVVPPGAEYVHLHSPPPAG